MSEITRRDCDICGKQDLQHYATVSVFNSHYPPHAVWPTSKSREYTTRSKDCCSIECARKELARLAKEEIDVEGLQILAEQKMPNLTKELESAKREIEALRRQLGQTTPAVNLVQSCPTYKDLLQLFSDLLKEDREARKSYKDLDGKDWQALINEIENVQGRASEDTAAAGGEWMKDRILEDLGGTSLMKADVKLPLDSDPTVLTTYQAIEAVGTYNRFEDSADVWARALCQAQADHLKKCTIKLLTERLHLAQKEEDMFRKKMQETASHHSKQRLSEAVGHCSGLRLALRLVEAM